MLISGNLWNQRYGGERSVIGRTVRTNGTTATIIGVMPDGLRFPNNADIWMPTGSLSPAIVQAPRQARGYFAIGRLADGVTVEQARTELTAIGKKLSADFPTRTRTSGRPSIRSRRGSSGRSSACSSGR